MPYASKLFTYLFCVWCKYHVTVMFVTLMSCDSVCCMCGEVEAVTDWWRRWPMVNMLVCLCSCLWWTFWTYLVTDNLFSLYLMNFMFHTTLGAMGDILKVHFKSLKCDVSFSQGSISTLCRWGEHLSCMCKNVLRGYSTAKIIKNQTSFSRVMITNVLPHFLWMTV